MWWKYHCQLDHEEEVNEIYWETEQKCRKYTFRLGCYVLVHTSVFPISITHALYCLSRGDKDTSAWFMAYPVLLPFDMDTVSGWMMTWACEWCMGLAYTLSVTSVTAYFVSCCFYIDGMCDHFNFMMQSISKEFAKNQLKEKSNVSKHQSNVEDQSFLINVRQKLKDAVQLHIRIFELV